MERAKKLGMSIFRKLINLTNLRRRTWLSSVLVAALIGASLIVSLANATEDTGDSTALRTELQRLESATDIVLMIIPSKMSFLRRMNEKDLPNVACLYQISRSNRGPSYADVREILQSSIVEFQKGSVWLSEVRLGVFSATRTRLCKPFTSRIGAECMRSTVSPANTGW
jgi:hypothetical protein